MVTLFHSKEAFLNLNKNHSLLASIDLVGGYEFILVSRMQRTVMFLEIVTASGTFKRHTA